jgi:cytochrome b
MQKILVWDWPVRLGHWLLAAAFCVAWLTSESESWRLVHVIAGAVVLAVVSYRLLWGLIGSTHARFGSFLRGPEAVGSYLGSLLKFKPAHHTGHNPAGGWAIIALLVLGLLTSLSGWLLYDDIFADTFEELHEALASTMLAVVVIHLAGVAAGSVLHKENLPRAMLTGSKLGLAGEAIASSRPLAGLFLLVWVASISWYIAS